VDAEGSAAGTEAVMGVVQILSSKITNMAYRKSSATQHLK
jgi:hypothetical protein